MKEKYRHELKYLISNEAKDVMCLKMKEIFKMDSHAQSGGYVIRSIYFDDYWNSALNDKDNGILERSKWRIRIYNYSDESIKLERKKKFGNYIYKESAALTKEEALKLIEGDFCFLLKMENELLKQFYVDCISRLMKPRVIVDYERIPFIMDGGTVRVTFDMNVRAAILSNNIFDDKLPTLSCIESGKCIMEVKFTEFLPQMVRDIVPSGAADITAFSKYVTCAQKTGYLHGCGYFEDTDRPRADMVGGLK